MRSGFVPVIAALLLPAVIVLLKRALRRALGGDPELASDVARRIAGGDLGVPVDTRNASRRSVLYAIEDMRKQLAQVVAAIKGLSSRPLPQRTRSTSRPADWRTSSQLFACQTPLAARKPVRRLLLHGCRLPMSRSPERRPGWAALPAGRSVSIRLVAAHR
jgi:hypothetical protein